jgi:uncharacterized protein (DUF2267 family)
LDDGGRKRQRQTTWNTALEKAKEEGVQTVPETGYSAFNKTVDKTNHILRKIEDAYGWPKERRNQSYAALRSVLHALRDRLTIEEIPQLAAQLPMLVKGIYYEGWDPTKTPMKMNADEFLSRIRQEFRWELPDGVDRLVRTVLSAIRDQISQGEWEDVRSSVPADLRHLLPA